MTYVWFVWKITFHIVKAEIGWQSFLLRRLKLAVVPSAKVKAGSRSFRQDQGWQSVLQPRSRLAAVRYSKVKIGSRSFSRGQGFHSFCQGQDWQSFVLPRSRMAPSFIQGQGCKVKVCSLSFSQGQQSYVQTRSLLFILVIIWYVYQSQCSKLFLLMCRISPAQQCN